MSRKKIRLARVLLGMLCMFAACASRAAAQPIYYDDFSGSSASLINGTAPDIRPGSETWAAGSQLKADGSVGGSFGIEHHAYLPFVPASGTVYALSADFNVTGGESTNHFMALAFADSAITTFTNYDHFVGLIYKRTNLYNGTDDIGTQQGPFGANSDVFDYNPGGVVNLKVVLDTQPALWTVEWFVDNTSIRGPVAFATNPTINYVSYGTYRNTTGIVDNFTVVPEPSAIMFGMLGALGFLAFRRWR